MNAERPDGPSTVAGALAAGAIMAAAAAVFFVTHGYATGWNLSHELWDADYYFGIAAAGYRGGSSHLLAFLPGYPILLIPAARLLSATPFLASFVTSSILSVLGGVVLYRVLRRHLGAGISLAGIALLAFSPFSIYLFNGYSEPAFFLAAVLALLCLQEGRLLPAAAAVGYAFICRPYAIALVPLFLPPVWRLLRERDIWKTGWIVVLGALPALLYCGWMYHFVGDPFIASKALTHWDQYETISSAWPLPIRTWFAFRFAFRDSAPGSWALSLIFYFLAACAILAAAGRLPRRLTVYSLLLLACVYFTDALAPVNLGRHALLAFAAGPAIAVTLYARRDGTAWAAAARHCGFALALLFFVGAFIVMGTRFSQGMWVS